MNNHKRKALRRELKAVEELYAGTLDWLELGELRSWVEAGNSPYENPEQVLHEDGTSFDFIEWHRAARWVTVRTPPGYTGGFGQGAVRLLYGQTL